jgi:hypothetical protein
MMRRSKLRVALLVGAEYVGLGFVTGGEIDWIRGTRYDVSA